MKFKRPSRPNVRNVNDEPGTVRIQIMLMEGSTHGKVGNITRTLRVAEAKVSEVTEAIEAALFE